MKNLAKQVKEKAHRLERRSRRELRRMSANRKRRIYAESYRLELEDERC